MTDRSFSLPRSLRNARRVATEISDFVVFALRRFYADGLGMAAGALTYSTLLALVPLMVITFAILSGFPAFDAARGRMEELFLGTLVPEVGAGVQDYISRFSRNASNLTAVGIVALAVTAVLLLSTIEATLNRIWRVERARPFGVRLLIFWTILTLGPLLFGASVAVTSDFAATARSWAGGGVGVTLPVSFRNMVIAVLAQSAAFTLLYMLVPARPVRLRDAALGGVIAGIAFQLLRWGFNRFLTSGSTYDTIYGAVAVFPIFLVWIYASWTVIIYGAVIAAAFPDWWRTKDSLPEREYSPGERLEVAVALLSVLARAAKSGQTVTQTELQETAPLDVRDDIAEGLRRTGYIVATENDEMSLSRDIYTTTVRDLARDLGLALGLPEADDGETSGEALVHVSSASGELPAMLRRLDEAETDILDRPIAKVLDPSLDRTGDLFLVGRA